MASAAPVEAAGLKPYRVGDVCDAGGVAAQRWRVAMLGGWSMQRLGDPAQIVAIGGGGLCGRQRGGGAFGGL